MAVYNVVQVVRITTVSAPRMPDRTFAIGEQVNPGSAYYWQLVWSGNATDTGIPWPDAVADISFEAVMAQDPAPRMFVSTTEPTALLAIDDLWFKPQS